MHLDTYYRLLDTFSFQENKCLANEISISLNCLDLYYPSDRLATHYLDILPYLSRGSKIQVVVHSLKELAIYPNYSNILEIQSLCLSNIEMSDIEALKKIRDHGVRITWNYIPDNRPMENILSIAQHIDAIYLLLRKLPLWSCYSEIEAQAISWLEIDIDVIKDLKRKLGSKAIIDTCIQDALCYQIDGTGCSASISKFHIWADGTVTGCPYISDSITPPTNTVEGIIQNIHLAAERYDWYWCYIKDFY